MIPYKFRPGKASSVRLIGADGTMLGVFTVDEAYKMAAEVGLDLAEVNGLSVPPVCKLLDFGKAKYEHKKNKIKPKKLDLKELQLTIGIADNDLATKANKTTEWLAEGHEVMVRVRYANRQLANQKLGYDQLAEFLQALPQDKYQQKAPPVLSGKHLVVILKHT